MNIQSKFNIPTLIFTIISFLIFGTLLISDYKMNLEEDFDNKKDRTIYLAGLVTAEPLWSFNYSGVEANILAILDDNDIVRIKVKDINGETILDEFKQHNTKNIIVEKSLITKDDERLGEIEIQFSKHRIDTMLRESAIRIAVLMVILIFIIAGTIVTVSFIVTKPIKLIQDYSIKIKDGDFSHKLNIVSSDEIGHTGKMIEDTINKLNTVLKEIDAGQDAITRSANDISVANDTLAAKTNEQAESLQETTSIIEEISSIVSINSEKTKEVNILTQKTSTKIKESGDDSKKLEKAMLEIINSSKDIDTMINVIDEIAFQTNLLALNAAVEAARAGDQNKGFTVIAEEIRNLAKTSSKAAKDIKIKIKDSEIKITEGSMYIKQTLQNINEVMADVNNIATVMADIAESVIEQEKGIDHIKESIFSLDNITQHNASVAEETAAITNELRNEAYKLSKIFKFFKLGD